jgi:drug/metabolite transporter (DMT)-like permease
VALPRSVAAPATSFLAELVMLGANVVYGTSYVVARLTLESVPPATLAFLRLAIASLVLVLLSRSQPATPLSRADRRAIAWMGILGFAAALSVRTGESRTPRRRMRRS